MARVKSKPLALNILSISLKKVNRGSGVKEDSQVADGDTSHWQGLWKSFQVMKDGCAGIGVAKETDT